MIDHGIDPADLVNLLILMVHILLDLLVARYALGLGRRGWVWFLISFCTIGPLFSWLLLRRLGETEALPQYDEPRRQPGQLVGGLMAE
jgi:hypothetical protein